MRAIPTPLSPAHALSALRAHGVSLRLESGELAIGWGEFQPTIGVVEEMRRLRGELTALLRAELDAMRPKPEDLPMALGPARELLDHLRGLGATVVLTGDDTFSVRGVALDAATVERVRSAKPAILRCLRAEAEQQRP